MQQKKSEDTMQGYLLQKENLQRMIIVLAELPV